MDTNVLIALIAGTALVLGQIVQSFLSRAQAKSDLEGDLELYKALPAESTAKVDLLTDIDRRIYNRIRKNSATRYVFGIVLSVLLLVTGVWFGYLWWGEANWYRWAFGVLAVGLVVFGLVGVSIYASKKERGPDGLEVRRDTES
ncbi:hypothetical protein VH571_07305 [Frondihabitans sp. 4ASC-45]|uniref:hypothetical protein n=1 Tax=Frondihabitans sp. 4ASC-45 TaxID=3111636 RepID=UPI003C1ABF1F